MSLKSLSKSAWSWIPSLYFIEGIPYFIVTSVSIVLLTQLGMPNSQMSFYTSLISLPWIFKPLWSPFVDVIKTKRWWVIVMQFGMAVLIGFLAWCIREEFMWLALLSFLLIALDSATNDIASDGLYMLALSTELQARYVGLRSTFYKIANIFCQSGLLLLAGWLQKKYTVADSWTLTFIFCGLLLSCLAIWHWLVLPRNEYHDISKDIPTRSSLQYDTHLADGNLSPNDHSAAQGEGMNKNGIQNHLPTSSQHRSIMEEVLQIFVLFFKKPHIGLALSFMLLYRLPEALLLKLCNPFYLDGIEKGGLGLTLSTVGQMYGVGVVAMLVGGIIGGWVVSKTGLKKMILWFNFFLTLPCIVYVYMAYCQPTSNLLIVACIAFEQFGYGVGYTACMLYLIQFAEGRYQTAHFALCTAFMFLGLLLPGLFAGYLQELMGYALFFVLVMITTVPSIAITLAVKKRL